MNIMTVSIRDDIEIQLNKSIEEVSNNDLLKIKKITLNRLGYGDEVKNVNYNEVSLFKNLEELNVFNCMINEDFVRSIMGLKKIKILKLYNCDFVDYVSRVLNVFDLEELVINNCIGIEDVKIEKLKYLELKNVKMSFPIINVGVLNVSNINEKINLGVLKNIGKIIISEKDYNNYKDVSKVCSNVTIVNDRMMIVKEI